MKTKRYRYSQMAIVEFRNAGPWITIFKSNKKITIDIVAKFLEEKEGFNAECDSVIFVNKPNIQKI